MLTYTKLRVTAARPGVVNFELDIKKEHTVSSHYIVDCSSSFSSLFLLVFSFNFNSSIITITCPTSIMRRLVNSQIYL